MLPNTVQVNQDSKLWKRLDCVARNEQRCCDTTSWRKGQNPLCQGYFVWDKEEWESPTLHRKIHFLSPMVVWFRPRLPIAYVRAGNYWTWCASVRIQYQLTESESYVDKKLHKWKGNDEVTAYVSHCMDRQRKRKKWYLNNTSRQRLIEANVYKIPWTFARAVCVRVLFLLFMIYLHWELSCF